MICSYTASYRSIWSVSNAPGCDFLFLYCDCLDGSDAHRQKIQLIHLTTYSFRFLIILRSLSLLVLARLNQSNGSPKMAQKSFLQHPSGDGGCIRSAHHIHPRDAACCFGTNGNVNSICVLCTSEKALFFILQEQLGLYENDVPATQILIDVISLYVPTKTHLFSGAVVIWWSRRLVKLCRQVTAQYLPETKIFCLHEF